MTPTPIAASGDALSDAQGNSRETVAELESSSNCEIELGPFLPALESPDLFPELSESQAHGSERGVPQVGRPVPLQLETTGVISHQPEIKPKPVVTSKKSQGEFWARQTCHKESVIAKLHLAGRPDLANPLETCHTEAHYAKCTSCSSVKVLLNRCDRFYCPECQPSLSRDRRRQVEWWSQEIQQPKHIVLTLQNLPVLDKSCVRQAKSFLSRLRRRSFCSSWRGGFYSLEVTNEGKGWHLHFHLLVDVRYVDCRLLSAEWQSATDGWGRIVKVRDCRSGDYLAEVTKYAVKGNQLAAWSPEHIATFIDAFTGVRTFGVFGSLFGKRTEFREWFNQVSRQQLQCKCGCCDFNILNELEWRMISAGVPLHLVRGP